MDMRNEVTNEIQYIEQELKKFKLVFEGIKNDGSFSDADLGQVVTSFAIVVKLSAQRYYKYGEKLKGN